MLDGINIVGFNRVSNGNTVPTSQATASLPAPFQAATAEEVEQAVQMATQAATKYSEILPEERARFLEAIAEEIEALGDALLEQASAESNLPPARFQGERGRTCNQLRLFAQVVREGSWVEATLDTPDPHRTPLPKPDVRKYLVGLGPVVVFTASNFPLAFSTAGGDTASALAAGCPVIVKAHEAHLGTNELVAKAVIRAAQRTGMPEGVFSSLNGEGYKTGQQLVLHPEVKGVGFTGSYRGGMALYQLAQKRREPIPVFAEMGSINPVVLCPQAVASNTEGLAQTMTTSITLGVGQFCTNPGLLIGIASPALNILKSALAAQLDATSPGLMLTEGITQAYVQGKQSALDQAGVQCLTRTEGTTTLATTTAENFLAHPDLQQEVFGPFSLLVECTDASELLAVLHQLEGQLTGTIMAEQEDQELASEVAQALQKRVGRLIFNGAPTGVEVGHAMHHGGPFPATTDSRFTSVGTAAIQRFTRPVCYQDFPEEMLPAALQTQNPLSLLRKVDGQWKR